MFGLKIDLGEMDYQEKELTTKVTKFHKGKLILFLASPNITAQSQLEGLDKNNNYPLIHANLP